MERLQQIFVSAQEAIYGKDDKHAHTKAQEQLRGRNGLRKDPPLPSDVRKYVASFLVILDVMMPKMSGWDVLGEIRKKDKAVPIMMLTDPYRMRFRTLLWRVAVSSAA